MDVLDAQVVRCCCLPRLALPPGVPACAVYLCVQLLQPGLGWAGLGRAQRPAASSGPSTLQPACHAAF